MNNTDPLTALTLRYRASLPEKSQALAAAWLELEQEPSDQTYEKLRLLTHRLAGSAGSYGFEQIGAAAIQLERVIVAREVTGVIETAHHALQAALVKAINS